MSSLDICAQKAVKLLGEKSHQVPAADLLAPPAFNGALQDVISQYWNSPSTTPEAFAAKVADVLKQPF
jgi:glucose/mannose transport system substrate-binding protein